MDKWDPPEIGDWEPGDLIPVTDDFGNIVDWVPESTGDSAGPWGCIAILVIAVTLGIFILPFYALAKGIIALRKGYRARALLYLSIPFIYVVAGLSSAVWAYAEDNLLCRQVDVWASVEKNELYINTTGPKNVGISIDGGEPEDYLVGMGMGGVNTKSFDKRFRTIELIYVWKYGHTPAVMHTKFEMCNQVIVQDGHAVVDSPKSPGETVYAFLEALNSKVTEYWLFSDDREGQETNKNPDSGAVDIHPDDTTWIQRNSVSSPSARKNHKMAYDNTRGVTVLFGGDDGSQIRSDTWEWDGDTWTERNPHSSPPARYHHALAYDSARGVSVLFGGRNNGEILGDTWEWDGSSWTESTPTVSPPSRWIHAMTYDSTREVVVLFGGTGDCGGSCNDTWEWDGTTWTKHIPSTTPPGRWGHNMAYDRSRGVTVLFGGRNNVFSLENTWEWNGTTWVQRTSSPTPSARDNPTLIFDSLRGVTILFGGDDDGYQGDTWEWDGTVWAVSLPPTSPNARDCHAMVYDSGREVTVLFGGNIGDWPFVRLADTWEFGQIPARNGK